MNLGPVAGLDLPHAQVWNGQILQDHVSRQQRAILPQRRHTPAGVQQSKRGHYYDGSTIVQTQASRLTTSSSSSATGNARESSRNDVRLEAARSLTHDNHANGPNLETVPIEEPITQFPFPCRPKLRSSVYPNSSGGDRRVVTVAASKHRESPVNLEYQTSETHGKANALWTGNHPEDRLTDQSVKSGFCEKQQVLNESNSAKSVLWPHLKNKTGLQALGSLFAAVLQQRQEAQRIHSVSTFKPPPRVTLTDTKREAWLRDLSNSAIPLRRLSRTIPHGIRGKALLDQCVAKRIPISRAIWLAKCIGANEIRASKRKGVISVVTASSESKWVKEWTATLEAFIEDNLDRCAEPGANYAIPYAMQISVYFYQEGLLDREQFLDWQLGYFEKCSVEKIPICLLVIQVYISKLSDCFRSTRRLVTLCVQKVAELSKSKHSSVMRPVSERLQRLTHGLVISHFDTLTLQSWSDCRPVLLHMAKNIDHSARQIYQIVIERNDRLWFNNTGPTPFATVFLRLFAVLDKVHEKVHIDQVYMSCLSTLPVEQGLVVALLQWAASDYREGDYRIHLVVRIIWKVSSNSFDIHNAIFEALIHLRLIFSASARTITLVLTQLVRLQIFDCARYLRWLMTIGTLHGCTKNDICNRCDLQFLVDMPLHGLPKHVLQLRTSLLRRCGVIPMDGESVLCCKALIAIRLPELRKFIDQVHNRYQDPEHNCSINNLSLSVSFEITSWLRSALFRPSSGEYLPQLSVVAGNRFSICINQGVFFALREILVGLGDFATLADILTFAAASADAELLQSITETMVLHFKIFAAMAVDQEIYENILAGFRALQPNVSFGTDVISTFLHLGRRVGIPPGVSHYLECELKSCDENIGVAAFTPISDIMSDSISCVETEDEIERLLTSSCTMDEATSVRVFHMIITSLQQESSCTRNTQSYCSIMLMKLSRQNKHECYRLLADWTRTLFLEHVELAVTVFFTKVVAGQLLTLQQICESAESCIASLHGVETKLAATIAAKALTITFRPNLLDCNGDDEYQFLIDQMQLCETQPRMILQLLCQATPRKIGQIGGSAIPSFCTPMLYSVVRRLIHEDVKFALSHLHTTSLHHTMISTAALTSFVCNIVDPRGQSGLSAMSAEQVIETLFSSVDALSLPMMQYLLHVVTFSGQDRMDIQDAIISASQASMLRDCPWWVQLLSILDFKLLQGIRNVVENALLRNHLACDPDPTEPDSSALVIRRALNLVKAMASGSGDSTASNNSATLLECLRLLQSILETTRVQINTDSQCHGLDSTISRLEALLELSLVHVQSYARIDSSFLIDLLKILCPLLHASASILPTTTLQFLLDIIGSVAADLKPSSLSQVTSSFLPSTLQDPRIRFRFGIHDQPDAWLHVTQSATASNPKPGVSSNMSSQHVRPTLPFPLRRWELLPDSTANVEANDTALSLTLFDARRL